MKDKRSTQMIFGIFLGGFIYILMIHWLVPLILGIELFYIFLDAQYYGYPPSLDTLFGMILQAFMFCNVLGVALLAWAYPFQDKIINNEARILLTMGLLIPSIISIVLLTIFHLFGFDVGQTAALILWIGGILIGMAISWMIINRWNVNKFGN